MPRILLCLVLLTLATPALASDGVLEINQTCAVETGCVEGDSAGFPVTISQSGSYRLTGNLRVPDADTTAIEVVRISAEDIDTVPVTIDLAGFSILGPVRCDLTTSEVVCTPTGTGYGIDSSWRINLPGGGGIASVSTRVRVHDGTVMGMGQDGIWVGNYSRVENVTVMDNGGVGIRAGSTSVLNSNIANRNGGEGIRGALYCSVTRNIVGSNGGDGIYSGGISTGNEVSFNVGFGRRCVSSSDGYGQNVFGSNQLGSVSSGCLNMGGNVCNGSLTCP